jgi:hypothetical protein
MYSPFVIAGILLVVVNLMPEGLVGFPQLVKSWYMEHRKVKRLPVLPQTKGSTMNFGGLAALSQSDI